MPGSGAEKSNVIQCSAGTGHVETSDKLGRIFGTCWDMMFYKMFNDVYITLLPHIMLLFCARHHVTSNIVPEDLTQESLAVILMVTCRFGSLQRHYTI